MNLKAIEIPNLTPLRAIAALWVVIYHFNEVAAIFVNNTQTLFLKKCYLMVDLFFVMSGFIMLHVYGNQFAATIQKNKYWPFMVARFARIYPLHVFTLIVIIVFLVFQHQPFEGINDAKAIPTHLLLLHSIGLHKIFTWNVPSWSISAEWFAYLLFPFFAWLIYKQKNWGKWLIVLLALAIYVIIVYLIDRPSPFNPAMLWPHDLNITYDYGYLRGIAGFMMGLVTYLLYQQPAIKELMRKDRFAFIAAIGIVLALHFGISDLLFIPLYMFTVLTVAANTHRLHQLFSMRPLQYLGDISYSLYMVHSIMLSVFAIPILVATGYVYKGPYSLQIPFWTGVGYCSMYVAATILLSAFTYAVIEKPCRKWLNKKLRNKSI